MKSFIVIAVLCAVIYLASATPVPAEIEDFSKLYDLNDTAAGAEDALLLREKRVICDLWSILGVADSVCALHCIALGRPRFNCKSGTCRCL